jgi:transmembrane sensor
MSAMFTPITPEVLSAVRLGDESALERVYREHYDALIDEAVTQLGGTGSATKVAETAILRAWEQHDQFETPEALEAFLHRAVHDLATREKSRKAALHRFESHEGVHLTRSNGHGTLSVDESWRHVVAALHAPPPDAAVAAQHKAEVSRHVAAEHMAHVGKRRSPWITLGYVVAMFSVVVGILYGIFRETPEAKAGRFLRSPDSREIISRFAQTGNVTLDDQTRVTIGADSRLRIPPAFNTEVRVVGVTGTATFEATPGGAIPFEVRLGDVAVVATGTKFAVNFDTATTTAMVRVDEGSVNVRFGETIRPLAAGASLQVDKAGAMSEPSADALGEALGWTKGRVVIVNRTLREALEQTRRWYGIALIPADMTLMDRTVSVDAPIDSSTAMIADLESTGNMKFGWKDETMVLYDASAAPKGKRR